MCFQGDFDQPYELEHYHYDVFSWMLTRDEDVRLGRFPMTRPDFYLIQFKSDGKKDDIHSLVWVNDSAVPAGEVFRRDWKPKSDPTIALISVSLRQTYTEILDRYFCCE